MKRAGSGHKINLHCDYYLKQINLSYTIALGKYKNSTTKNHSFWNRFNKAKLKHHIAIHIHKLVSSQHNILTQCGSSYLHT